MNIRKTLRKIKVIQERTGGIRYSLKERNKQIRVNPFNPLSYVVLIATTTIGLILFGILGFPEQLEKQNPFKWR